MLEFLKGEGDGLLLPEIGDWGSFKYRLIRNYANLFTRSMRGKWNQLLYIDLFAGAGMARVEGTTQVLRGSPLLALGLEYPFSRHVFCESDPEKLDALTRRVSRIKPNADCCLIDGDVNAGVQRIINQLPTPGPGSKFLCFCVSDPYKMANLRFQTIQRLSSYFMDHLVLIPTHMDAHRNLGTYEKPNNTRIEDFTGQANWRKDWQEAKAHKEPFHSFIMNLFGRSMEAMGYFYAGIESTVLIRSSPKNLPLYRLAFFSRSSLGEDFWGEARKMSMDQQTLFG